MKEEQNSDEISFQIYIDAVRGKKIPWNTFLKLMKDFYYPALERLKDLNTMMLIELTKSYSDLERSRYLNAILLTELKNSIEEENVVENSDEIIQRKIPLDKKVNHEQNSESISFQIYIDSLRGKKIPWNTFLKLIKDFYYHDLERLKLLNTMILIELTEPCSDLERSRYLNAILLAELKNSIDEENIVVEVIVKDSQDYFSINDENKEQADDAQNEFKNNQSNEENKFEFKQLFVSM